MGSSHTGDKTLKKNKMLRPNGRYSAGKEKKKVLVYSMINCLFFGGGGGGEIVENFSRNPSFSPGNTCISP